MIPSKYQPSDFGDQTAAEDVGYAEILAHLGADPTTRAPGELLRDATHAPFAFRDSLTLAERRGVRSCNTCRADGDDGSEGEGDIARELGDGIEGKEGGMDRPRTTNPACPPTLSHNSVFGDTATSLKLKTESTKVESNMDYSYRAAKTRRIEDSTEMSIKRGVATLSHQMSMDSFGEARPRAASVPGIEEGSRRVSDNGKSDGDTDEEEFSGGFSDAEEEGFASITVDFMSEEKSGEEVGRFIGENNRLEKLVINGEAMDWINGANGLEWFEGVCTGASQNRTIGQLSLKECNLASTSATKTIATMSPFIELNANLHWLEIVGCNLEDKGARRLASSLSRRDDKASLRRIILDANSIGDAAGQELVDALRGYGNLRELSLGDNELRTDACTALGHLLSSPDTKLKELNVENNRIDDAGIAVLTDALAGNAVLTELNLSFNCRITQKGWRTFAECLQNPNSALEVLDLSSTNIADEGAVALGRSLVDNRTLRALYMCDISAAGMPLITATGWRSVFACLQKDGSTLERIDLGYGSIDEGGLLALARALAGNSSLNTVDVTHNKRISAAAWPPFFACLGRPDVALEEVNLRDNNITDEEMPRLARSLRANKKLQTIGLGHRSAVTDAGWAHFTEILCDKSSAAAVHSSNHALRSLGDPSVPEDLEDLLLLNSRRDERSASREKILRYYFCNGERNMKEFVDMEVNVVPHAFSWAGRNGSGLTLLYELVRSLPSLVSCANSVKASGQKRKRVS